MKKHGRAYGFAICVGAYMAAALVAYLSGLMLDGNHPIVVAAIADTAATIVVFAFSRFTDNSSLYDPYWSVAPPFLLAYYALGPWASGADKWRILAAFIVVSVWGIRLTYNWARRWQGLGDEDFRYVELRNKHGQRYWLVSFLGIHFFPTVLVFLGCLPLFYAATSSKPVGVLDGFGFAIAALAIWFEATADRELHAFGQSARKPDAILTSGLWRYSRHPNYFGEILFWWGVLGLGLGASREAYWTAIGALTITLLFKFVSVPLMETRMLEKRPHYAEHIKRTNAIFPWRTKS